MLNNTITAYIALGSNLGQSQQIIIQVMDVLQQYALAPIIRSSLWQSSPVNCPPNAPLFINAVIAMNIHADTHAEQLLDILQNIEHQFGRKRNVDCSQQYYQSRILDLDIIALGNQIIHNKRCTIPHPRAHLRQFVLQPLNEIAPKLILANQTQCVQILQQLVHTDEVLSRIES
ncbi:MAG: 2-amino-4-hydroxy-6-hydroxymethyldihydropteridine diphosphokinase [Mariprofundales bacterium]